MKWSTRTVGILILFFYVNLESGESQPQSNGHAPDCEPEFSASRVYGVYYREGVPVSENYGPIPPIFAHERNRIVHKGECRENSARDNRVYDVYGTENPASRRTVNGFLCGEANLTILMRKLEDSKYEKIRYDNYLLPNEVAALHAAAQGAANQEAGNQGG